MKIKSQFASMSPELKKSLVANACVASEVACLRLEPIERMAQSWQATLDAVAAPMRNLERMCKTFNTMHQANIRAISPMVKRVNEINEWQEDMLKPLKSLRELTTFETSHISHLSESFKSPDIEYVPSLERREEPIQVVNNITVHIHVEESTFLGRDFTIPKISRWEEVSIQFLDSHTVKIIADRETYKATFVDLNFMSQSTLSPLNSWKLLELFATNQGSIPHHIKSRRANFKQDLYALRKSLQKLFGIVEDPFENARDGDCRTKIDIAG